jgi:hypothetical protein
VTKLSASLIFSHLSCPHRTYMDFFASPSDRDSVSPFILILWERGSLYELEVVSDLGVQFLDLSGFRGDAKEAQTPTAIAANDNLIYGGRLTVDELVGEPDLLRKEGAGYVAIDIKSGGGTEGRDDDGKLKKTSLQDFPYWTRVISPDWAHRN